MARIKFLLLAILTIPLINRLLLMVVKLFRNSIPTRYLARIPVVDRVPVRYPELDEFVLLADGRDSIATQIYWRGINAFEPDEIAVYRALLPQVTTVLDIGSNIGMYALLAGSYSHIKQIFAFEPVPTIAKTLRSNVEANDYRNIHVHEIALTDFDGDVTLHIPVQPTYPLGSSTNVRFRKNTQPISVRAMTLDTFVAVHKIEKVEFMKVDTESTEPAVLRGAKQVVANHRPLIMCEVLRDRPRQEMTEFFAGKDYQVYRIENGGLSQIEHIEIDMNATNFLFVPIEKQSQLPQHLLS